MKLMYAKERRNTELSLSGNASTLNINNSIERTTERASRFALKDFQENPS
jgi:hypothetical protein